MANKFVIFPEAKEAQANAYCEAVNVHYAATYEPGGMFSVVKVDAYDQWVVAYFGPPWEFEEGDPVSEPAALIAVRADGVVHDFVVWELPPND